MAIEVLLRRSIEGVGIVGEVVKVKNGYARNYLFPMSYASPVTADALRNIEKDKAAQLVREKDMAKKRDLLLERLADVKLTIEARAGDDGHLYGSVGPRQVVLGLQGIGIDDFEERQVTLETVRELGEYEAELNLGAGVTHALPIWVTQDAIEAEEQREAAEAEAARIAEMGDAEEGGEGYGGDLLDAE